MSLGFGAQQSIVRGPLGRWVGWGKEGGWRGERKALFCSVSWSALLWEVCGQWRGPSASTALSPPQESPLLTIGQNQQWICLETLAPGTLYEFQVRVRAQRGSNSTWSPWSRPLAFRTTPEGKTELDRKGRLGVALGLLVGWAWATVLIFIISSLAVTLQGGHGGREGGPGGMSVLILQMGAGTQ